MYANGFGEHAPYSNSQSLSYDEGSPDLYFRTSLLRILSLRARNNISRQVKIVCFFCYARKQPIALCPENMLQSSKEVQRKMCLSINRYRYHNVYKILPAFTITQPKHRAQWFTRPSWFRLHLFQKARHFHRFSIFLIFFFF